MARAQGWQGAAAVAGSQLSRLSRGCGRVSHPTSHLCACRTPFHSGSVSFSWQGSHMDPGKVLLPRGAPDVPLLPNTRGFILF